jgi:hypothetical protein
MLAKLARSERSPSGSDVTDIVAEHPTLMDPLRAARLPLSGAVLAVAASCWTAGNVTTANPEPMPRSGETSATKRELPASCVTFLAEIQCRLRASGNEGPTIDRALGALRASLEAPPPTDVVTDPDGRCKNDIRMRRSAIESAGCEGAVGRLADLPPSRPANCGPQEFFFVRSDGHVSGCRRDCVGSQDCPAGTSCTAIGFAPGGPLDEPFCE